MTREHAPSLLGSQRSFGSGPVECLGHTFPGDDTRRSHFRERLRQYPHGRGLRQAGHCPSGEAKDILALSDPPAFSPPRIRFSIWRECAPG
jgi:hypothetical protein